MQIIFFLILVSLILAAGFLLSYLWAVREGQFDDDYTPAVRMLFDDTKPQAPNPAAAEGEIEKDHASPDDANKTTHTFIEQ